MICFADRIMGYWLWVFLSLVSRLNKTPINWLITIFLQSVGYARKEWELEEEENEEEEKERNCKLDRPSESAYLLPQRIPWMRSRHGLTIRLRKHPQQLFFQAAHRPRFTLFLKRSRFISLFCTTNEIRPINLFFYGRPIKRKNPLTQIAHKVATK